MARSWW